LYQVVYSMLPYRAYIFLYCLESDLQMYIAILMCYKQAIGTQQMVGFIDPQTEADRSAQHCIVRSLRKFPKVQIFGEEVVAFLDICLY